jgi:hypothetical protein
VVLAPMRRVISPMVIERRKTQCVGADAGPTCAAAGSTARPLRHFPAAPSFSPSQVGRRTRARTAGVSRWPRRERKPASVGAIAMGADHKSGNRGCAALPGLRRSSHKLDDHSVVEGRGC